MDLMSRINVRLLGIKPWLETNSPEALKEQKHLDEGTSERAYWHAGYMQALQDVRKISREARAI